MEKKLLIEGGTSIVYVMKKDSEIYIRKEYKDDYRSTFRNELEIYNIIETLNSKYFLKIKAFGESYIEFNYEPGTVDLLTFLETKKINNTTLLENDAKKIFKQIVEAVTELLKIRVIHGDLKDDNVLINDKLEIKLIDFGCSFVLYKKDIDIRSINNTFLYCPPEYHYGNSMKALEMTSWSLGVILYIILEGKEPFEINEDEITIKRFVLTTSESLSNEAKDLISSLLCIDPFKRIQVSDILKHKWLSINDE